MNLKNNITFLLPQRFFPDQKIIFKIAFSLWGTWQLRYLLQGTWQLRSHHLQKLPKVSQPLATSAEGELPHSSVAIQKINNCQGLTNKWQQNVSNNEQMASLWWTKVNVRLWQAYMKVGMSIRILWGNFYQRHPVNVLCWKWRWRGNLLGSFLSFWWYQVVFGASSWVSIFV